MSANDTPSSTSPSGASTPASPKYATFAKYVESQPPSKRVSVYKVHSLARSGRLPVYKLPGIKAACVNVAEADALLASLAAQGKIRRGYGSFGPDAVVRDLSNVAGQSFEVDQ